MTWLSENIWTLLIIALLILVVALILRGIVRDRRQGRHLCGGNCGACPMGGRCGRCGKPAGNPPKA